MFLDHAASSGTTPRWHNSLLFNNMLLIGWALKPKKQKKHFVIAMRWFSFTLTFPGTIIVRRVKAIKLFFLCIWMWFWDGGAHAFDVWFFVAPHPLYVGLLFHCRHPPLWLLEIPRRWDMHINKDRGQYINRSYPILSGRWIIFAPFSSFEYKLQSKLALCHDSWQSYDFPKHNKIPVQVTRMSCSIYFNINEASAAANGHYWSDKQSSREH